MQYQFRVMQGVYVNNGRTYRIGQTFWTDKELDKDNPQKFRRTAEKGHPESVEEDKATVEDGDQAPEDGEKQDDSPHRRRKKRE